MEIKKTPFDIVRGIVDGYLTKFPKHTEIAERAGVYTIRRIHEGYIKTETEIKATWSAFADGFCTGKGHGN
jgi:hypothetical protein